MAGKSELGVDCQHFLHKGTCKFGLECRHLHQTTQCVQVLALHLHPVGPDPASKRKKFFCDICGKKKTQDGYRCVLGCDFDICLACLPPPQVTAAAAAEVHQSSSCSDSGLKESSSCSDSGLKASSQSSSTAVSQQQQQQHCSSGL